MERKQKLIENLIKRTKDAKYNFVPEILLEGRDVLSGSESDVTVVKGMLWKVGFMNLLSEALERDYLKVKNDWLTASKINDFLINCCQDNKLANESGDKYQTEFLNETCKRMWILMYNIHQIYMNNKGLKRLEVAFRNVSVNVYVLCKNNKRLAKTGFEIPSTLRMLQSEITILDLTLIELCSRLSKLDRSFISDISQHSRSQVFLSVLSKFVVTKDSKLASLCLSTILIWIESWPTLMSFINNKQEEVVETINKWKGRNFDLDLTKLSRYIETSSLINAEEERARRASVMIQSYWRSYATRKRLAKMKAGFIELHNLFRQKKAQREKLKRQEGIEMERQFENKMKNIKENIKFLEKQYHAIGLVDRYLEERADWAARKIQSAWKGYKTRKHLAAVKQEAMLNRAAKTIQKTMIKYTERQKRLKYRLREWPGLTEERREQLQKKIDQWNDEHKVYDLSHQPDRKTLADIHQKCQEKLVALYASRLNELNEYQKREALLARLQIDSGLLENAPKLHEASQKDVVMFSSKNSTISLAALYAHRNALKFENQPKWKKLLTELETYD